MMDDPGYYKYALGIAYAIPSAETLRQRFDMIGDSLRGDILQANIDMLREMKTEPSALENGYVPVDIDITPFDNSKTKNAPIKDLTDTHQSWPIWGRKDNLSTHSCAPGNSTAGKKHRISCARRLTCAAS